MEKELIEKFQESHVANQPSVPSKPSEPLAQAPPPRAADYGEYMCSYNAVVKPSTPDPSGINMRPAKPGFLCDLESARLDKNVVILAEMGTCKRSNTGLVCHGRRYPL